MVDVVLVEVVDVEVVVGDVVDVVDDVVGGADVGGLGGGWPGAGSSNGTGAALPPTTYTGVPLGTVL